MTQGEEQEFAYLYKVHIYVRCEQIS